MKQKQQFDTKQLIEKAASLIAGMKRYSLALFIAFVGIVYGFILFQINTLSQAEPSPEAVSSQVQAAQTPHIDKKVVNQLESLQDNSVNVQTLFNNARDNPFQ